MIDDQIRLWDVFVTVLAVGTTLSTGHPAWLALLALTTPAVLAFLALLIFLLIGVGFVVEWLAPA